jgi:nucleotide-binding universal stress UspA family protein
MDRRNPMKVVLGVDGSKYGQWATEWVARLPLANRPKVVAVHALDLVGLQAPVMVQPMIIGNRPFIQAEAKRLVREAKRIAAETKVSLASLDVEGKVRIERGAPAPTLLKHARRGDLVVIGSRGLSAIDRFMLGSVSLKVTQHAQSSVLVVKQPPRPIAKILFATDGSKSSEKAVRFLLQTLRPDEMEVLVTHVMPFLRYPELKEAGQAVVDRYAERLAQAGYRINETLKLGHAADEIIKVAGRQKVDLIVAGAKGLGALARFFLGSVSTTLVQHSPCSVLIVR